MILEWRSRLDYSFSCDDIHAGSMLQTCSETFMSSCSVVVFQNLPFPRTQSFRCFPHSLLPSSTITITGEWTMTSLLKSVTPPLAVSSTWALLLFRLVEHAHQFQPIYLHGVNVSVIFLHIYPYFKCICWFSWHLFGANWLILYLLPAAIQWSEPNGKSSPGKMQIPRTDALVWEFHTPANDWYHAPHESSLSMLVLLISHVSGYQVIPHIMYCSWCPFLTHVWM